MAAEAMRAAFARAGGGIEDVVVEAAAVPSPEPGEALVRLTAATLNYRDLLAVDGLMPGIKQPRFIPLSDAVGEVAAVAEGVTRVAVGDRVSPLFAQGWLDGSRPSMAMLGGPVDGVARDYAAFDAESLVRIPDALDDPAAAALPCAGLTAWNALFGGRPIAAGEWVLVQGTGGVATAALQLAVAAGARVIATSSSDEKLARVAALGAEVGINYRTGPDWPAAARRASGGGVDLLVDTVGDAQVSAAAVRESGTIAAVGRLSGEHSWGKQVGREIRPVVVGNRAQHEALIAFCVARDVRPVIDARFGLDRLADALRHLRGGRAFGKIAIAIAGATV